ncbi:MAG: hypothetical protein IJS75_04135 [Bacteroidales bacterium]|nr:hypothetical protein [Bacteroidales bacterium]
MRKLFYHFSVLCLIAVSCNSLVETLEPISVKWNSVELKGVINVNDIKEYSSNKCGFLISSLAEFDVNTAEKYYSDYIDYENKLTIKDLEPSTTYKYAFFLEKDEIIIGKVSQFTTNEYPYRAIDLGLSVKWASCNLGAESPYDLGDHFAWGETESKYDFSWESLKYWKSGGDYLFDIVDFLKYTDADKKKVLDIIDDAARAICGGNWRMPTKEEFDELVTKCTWRWENNYFEVTGPNGNSIILPGAGQIGGGNELGMSGNPYNDGYYWSSTVFYHKPNDITISTNCTYAYSLHFSKSGTHSVTIYTRKDGFSIRPVCK